MKPKKAAETIEIELGSATVLADVREPPWRTKKAGTFVLLHGYGGSRADFETGGLATAIAALGFRTVAFELREAASYDDLVQRDLPAVVRLARARNRPKNGAIVVLGHALGGHAAIASQAIGALGADAVISVAGCPWVRDLEPSNVRWLFKRTAMRVLDEATDRGVSSALRSVGVGQGDAATTYAGPISRAARNGDWTSDDGAHDYLAALSGLIVPVLVVAEKNDKRVCPPACAAELVSRCGPRAALSLVDERTEVAPRIARWLGEEAGILGRRP